MLSCFRYIVPLVALLALSPARADEASVNGAQQVVGLFAHSCLLYPLRKEELRERLKEDGIPPLMPEANGALLNGRAGEGFDASNALAKMALISADNETCTVLGETADSAELIRSLEMNLNVIKSSITADWKLLGEHADAKDPSLHHRDYRVTINTVPFTLVASTSDEPNRIQAFLTFGPYTPYNVAMPFEPQSESDP